MWHDLSECSSVGREFGKAFGQDLRQASEGLIRIRREVHNLVAEPADGFEREVEAADCAKDSPKTPQLVVVKRPGMLEGIQQRDVCGHAESCCGIETISPRRNGVFGFGYRDQEGALGRDSRRRHRAQIDRLGLAVLALEPHRTTPQAAVSRSAEPAICAPQLRFRSSKARLSRTAILGAAHLNFFAASAGRALPASPRVVSEGGLIPNARRVCGDSRPTVSLDLRHEEVDELLPE